MFQAQRYLLGGIEQLIIKYESILLPKAAHIIKGLYDNDICEEEAILAWGEKVRTTDFICLQYGLFTEYGTSSCGPFRSAKFLARQKISIFGLT